MFGREAAGHIERLVDDETLLFVAGPVEARSEVLSELGNGIAERALEAPALTPGVSTRELVELALDLARDTQLAEADREAERCLNGEHLDRTTMGIDAVRGAIERGEVGTLIVHEDAVDHFGDALDARYHEAGSNAEAIEGLLRAALDLSAECRFSRLPALLAEHEGVVAVRRW